MRCASSCPPHDVADLPEKADQVTVLDAGRIVHTGPTETFFRHTPPGTAPGRAAEGTYSALLGGAGWCGSGRGRRPGGTPDQGRVRRSRGVVGNETGTAEH